ncbi:ABC transporter substrate-binding protein [Halomonas sp. TRM85114]|nr:ABC transporter substrate-binding protein [Halomonas jincaotanensis]
MLGLWSLASLADESLHYPADPSAGPPHTLVINAALDLPQAEPVLQAFHRLHPEVELTYHNFTTLDLHQHFLDAPDAADVMISSAMPWQYQLANDGHAREQLSANALDWPAWARWRHELFAFTFEPIVMVVRRELDERYGALQGHADLLALLERHSRELSGRVVTYDPARSGAGYTYAIEESRLSPRYWELVAALGQTRAKLVDTTGEMLDGLVEGRYLVGYNLLGSYAREVVAANPELRLVVPDDYTLVIRRLAFVPQHAPHPETAGRFLDFLISETGQRILAEQTALGAIHPVLNGPGTAEALRQELGDALRPIDLGPGLLATLDDLKRQTLLMRWKREFSRYNALMP